MFETVFEIINNEPIAKSVFKMELRGDTRAITRAGQFVDIKIEGLFLRRPISVCDVNGDILTLICKVVGAGTDEMSLMQKGRRLDILTGLGNGYELAAAGDKPLLIGGGVGVPPMYLLAKKLIEQGKTPAVILGFNKADEVFYEREFASLGCRTTVTTADGSYGVKGFVTDALPSAGEYTHYYCCGPEPMLRAVYKKAQGSGEFSFETRMGCGFGACMGCSMMTKGGSKRICREGPVFKKEEIIWAD